MAGVAHSAERSSGGGGIQGLTRAEVISLVHERAPDAITTTGFATPGDGGGALYVRTEQEPSHAGKFPLSTGHARTTWYEITGHRVRPEMFGACSAAETPSAAAQNVAALRAAVAYFGRDNPGVIEIGAMPIDDTIVIDNGVTIQGIGLGRSSNPARPQSYLKWRGPAGRPMLKVINNFGFRVNDLRFIGDSSAKPSAAIEYYASTSGTGDVDFNGGDNIWIGQMFHMDTDQQPQFQRGLFFSGFVNGDTNSFRNVFIYGCDEEAIFLKNPNASGTSFDTLRIGKCRNAIRTHATVTIRNFYAHVSEHTFVLETGGKIYVDTIACEGSGGLLKVAGDVTRCVIRNGDWQVQAGSIFPDGRIVDVGKSTMWHIHMEDFGMQYNGSFGDEPTVLFRLYNTAGGLTNGAFLWRGGRGLTQKNLECGTLLGQHDARCIIFEPGQEISQGHAPRAALSFDFGNPGDRVFDAWRNDFDGGVNIFGGPLNVRRLPQQPYAPIVTAKAGAGSTAYSYRITALRSDGETEASKPGAVNNAAKLAPGLAENRISWTALKGAQGYRIYGRESGDERLLATVRWDDLLGDTAIVNRTPPWWVDDGSAVPGPTTPGSNSTGNAVIEGSLTLTNAGGSEGWRAPLYLGDYALWIDSGGALRAKSGAPALDRDGAEISGDDAYCHVNLLDDGGRFGGKEPAGATLAAPVAPSYFHVPDAAVASFPAKAGQGRRAEGDEARALLDELGLTGASEDAPEWYVMRVVAGANGAKAVRIGKNALYPCLALSSGPVTRRFTFAYYLFVERGVARTRAAPGCLRGMIDGVEDPGMSTGVYLSAALTPTARWRHVQSSFDVGVTRMTGSSCGLPIAEAGSSLLVALPLLTPGYHVIPRDMGYAPHRG